MRSGTCGANVDQGSVDSWTCELCDNEETLEASVVSDSVYLAFILFFLTPGCRITIAYFVLELGMRRGR